MNLAKICDSLGNKLRGAIAIRWIIVYRRRARGGVEGMADSGGGDGARRGKGSRGRERVARGRRVTVTAAITGRRTRRHVGGGDDGTRPWGVM